MNLHLSTFFWLSFFVVNSKLVRVTMDDQADSNCHKQWCSEVVSFSSQYGSEFSISYTVTNITGKPTTFPSYGDYTQCCVLVRTPVENYDCQCQFLSLYCLH